MPFIPHTPESLVARSDSKNPSTTCKGITTAGRPCRRPLSASPQSSPNPIRRSKNGVLAVLQPDDDEHDGAAAFFCWQHQDQASALTAEVGDGRRAEIVPVQQRTSIDTLVDRLGVLEVEEVGSPSKGRHKKHKANLARKETLPQKWQAVDGPLLAVSGHSPPDKRRSSKSRQSRSQPKTSYSFFCCIGSVDRDYQPPRSRQYEEKSKESYPRSKLPSNLQVPARSANRSSQGMSKVPNTAPVTPMSHHTAQNRMPLGSTIRPPPPTERPSQTEDLLSLIPKTLNPQSTSLLLAELAKPVSTHDEEGYIYIFWLTDADKSAPDTKTVSSLLPDTQANTPDRRQRNSSQPQTPSKSNSGTSEPSTILLKIGRASNVQRRMNQWTRQCGYNLSLIRFYPYLPAALSPPATPADPQKVPFAHKVERLIHLELADQRVRRDCHSCGKEHREWFEVERSRGGLRKVDGVIRRWTQWAQRTNRDLQL